jgi:hypothetical protein
VAFTNTANNNIVASPQFAEWTNRNYRLTSASPCVNAGTNAAWMATALDLDGRPRLDHFCGRADMGAYEFLPSGNLVTFK